MKIEITYPLKKERKLRRQDVIARAKWPFLFTAYICPVLNIFFGGKAWSIVVLWSLWIVWSFLFSPNLVELNRISQFIKLIVNAAILLILIDVLLSPGWAMEVVPLVCFGGIVIAGTLFFTDLDRQKQNMMPVLLLSVISILSSVIGLIVWRHGSRWTLVVMGAFAIAFLAACFVVMGNDLIRELTKRFHTN